MIRREFLVTTALGTAGALATSMSGGEPSNQDMSTDVDGMPVMYSLGNFVFDSIKTDATRTGWLLRLALNRHGLTRWDTHIAFMDEDGLPQRRPGAASPCGKAGDTQVEKCINQ